MSRVSLNLDQQVKSQGHGDIDHDVDVQPQITLCSSSKTEKTSVKFGTDDKQYMQLHIYTIFTRTFIAILKL